MPIRRQNSKTGPARHSSRARARVAERRVDVPTFSRRARGWRRRPRGPPPPRPRACRRGRRAARASRAVDVEVNAVASTDPRARRWILADHGPPLLSTMPNSPPALASKSAFSPMLSRRSTARSSRTPVERGDRRARGLGRPGDRPVLVHRLRPAEDRDEQHTGQEAAGDGQRHAQRSEAALARSHLRRIAHAGACSAAKRWSSGSPLLGERDLDGVEVPRDDRCARRSRAPHRGSRRRRSASRRG